MHPLSPPPAEGTVPSHPLPEVAALALDALIEHLIQEMTQRWRAGERPVAEEYLARHPELWQHPGAATELIYEELCLRQEHGEDAAVEGILRRFPQWREPLRVLLGCHQLLETGPASPRFPAVGESLADFRLIAELGRGGLGMVFLATQATLADRPVVLKLVPCTGQEHLALARLQHTHIVPLYFVQDDPARDLRLLCMPYFGGTTLARLLEQWHGGSAGQRTGQLLLQALQQAQAASPIPIPVAGPACQFLAQASYVEAVCWMGACLAEALHYIHAHGLVHLDLKPSNVLWAADGQPMLLDLHLAQEPLVAGGPPPERLGGTPTYMAPEHEAALRAVAEARPVGAGVDGRADIYSLGVVLYEALGGTLPLPTRRPAQDLRRRNFRVTVGLADLLDRCLADDPSQRYPDAAAVAADLRRHLADLPLRGVANRSLTERWRKWRRRRPYGPVLLGLVFVIVASAVTGLAYMGQQAQKARTALQEATDHLQRYEYREAQAASRRGLALAEDLPFQGDLTRELRAQLRVAERAQAAQELHVFVERVRAFDSADGLAAGAARAVETHCHAFWQHRETILQRLGAQTDPELERQVRTDLLDLALLWTDLHVRLAPADETAAARKEALDVLDEAERLLGPSCVLCQQRQVHARALGLPDVVQAAERQGASLIPRTAWEHYALGRAFLRAGDLKQAAVCFERALDLEPQSLWPNFYKGRCAFQRGQYHDAVTAFTACVALAPRSGWCYHNRALAYAQLGRTDEALHDYGRALELDPTLAPAALKRGVLQYRQQHYTAALNDLQRALENGAAPAPVCYARALVYLAQGNRPAALASLHDALRHEPGHKEARALQDRLRHVP
jgi:serine/threonine protein kinase/tetratricopeptide (TPR) repeat protein